MSQRKRGPWLDADEYAVVQQQGAAIGAVLVLLFILGSCIFSGAR